MLSRLPGHPSTTVTAAQGAIMSRNPSVVLTDGLLPESVAPNGFKETG